MAFAARHFYERAADDFTFASARPRPTAYVRASLIDRAALDGAARRTQTRRDEACIDNHREHATHGGCALSDGSPYEVGQRIGGERRMKMQSLTVCAAESE